MKCSAIVTANYTSYACANPAKVEQNGKHYCGVHSFSRERQEKRDQKLREDAAQRHEYHRRLKLHEKRASLFAELLAYEDRDDAALLAKLRWAIAAYRTEESK